MTSCNAKNSLQTHTHLPHYSPRSHTHSPFQKIYLFLPLLSGCFVSCLSISISTNSFGRSCDQTYVDFFSCTAFYGKRKIFQDDNISQMHVVDIADLAGCYSYFLLNPNPSNWQISTPPEIKFLFENIPSLYFFPLNSFKQH